MYAWTCCHSTSRNAVGCSDDQSIGVKSNLPFIAGNYFFHNQLNIDHPLQHGSSLFVENNIKLHLMSDKDHTKSPKQQNLQRGFNARDIRGNHNNNSSNNHDDAIGAKYLPTNSIVDFYSPNKSSEFITRCKTKNYETMGLKRPETASALRSSPHLLKLSSQVISHLDPRLHKFKTEMRLNDEHNQLQQQQHLINNSFLVNVNTQSYSHSPSNNTIFKRRPFSANNLAILSGSRPIDHKSYNNNNNNNNNNNYQANNNNNNNDHNRYDSEANRNIASMLEASYNNNYNIDAPKSEVSSDINHQRPAVTSMSHKSIIGKTRVSTKQVKLSKNRPLTSPDGFGIYY